MRFATTLDATPEPVRVYIAANNLSDGSKVYDVMVNEIALHAYTQGDAIRLRDLIVSAINEHSLNLAR